MRPISSRVIRLIGLALMVGVVTGPSVWAQLRLTERGPSFQPTEEIVSIVGGESEAAMVVSQALRSFLEPSGVGTVSVFASQVPDAWLPVVPGVEFIRMSDADMRSHYASCGRYLWLTASKTDERLELTIGEGNKCHAHGQGVLFERTPGGWVRDSRRLGSGFVSGVSDCGCP